MKELVGDQPWFCRIGCLRALLIYKCMPWCFHFQHVMGEMKLNVLRIKGAKVVESRIPMNCVVQWSILGKSCAGKWCNSYGILGPPVRATLEDKILAFTNRN